MTSNISLASSLSAASKTVTSSFGARRHGCGYSTMASRERLRLKLMAVPGAPGGARDDGAGCALPPRSSRGEPPATICCHAARRRAPRRPHDAGKLAAALARRRASGVRRSSAQVAASCRGECATRACARVAELRPLPDAACATYRSACCAAAAHRIETRDAALEGATTLRARRLRGDVSSGPAQVCAALPQRLSEQCRRLWSSSSAKRCAP